jgi:sec-independent protein translocase protein TatA
MRARVPAVAGPADPQEVPVADLGWPELTIIAIAVVVLFGWKRMPDMARSLGRSARIFKSEVDQMKTPDPVAEADERAASADAEVARLREELETRRHQA